MTSYEVSIGLWAIGYTFHSFYGSFRCLSNRELVSTIPEDRMTHFVTLTVPPPRTDHILRYNTARVGFRARWFRIFWHHKKTSVSGHFRELAHDFRYPGQLFRNLPDFFQILVVDILWGFHWFLGHMVHIPCLLRAVSLPFQPRITVNHSGGQNDTFRHSNGPSSTYRP
jgi:hypothetical protein